MSLSREDKQHLRMNENNWNKQFHSDSTEIRLCSMARKKFHEMHKNMYLFITLQMTKNKQKPIKIYDLTSSSRMTTKKSS